MPCANFAEGRDEGSAVMHDDAKGEYACGPAQGLPNAKVGTFTQMLYDEAVKRDQHEERLEPHLRVRAIVRGSRALVFFTTAERRDPDDMQT